MIRIIIIGGTEQERQASVDLLKRHFTDCPVNVTVWTSRPTVTARKLYLKSLEYTSPAYEIDVLVGCECPLIITQAEKTKPIIIHLRRRYSSHIAMNLKKHQFLDMDLKENVNNWQCFESLADNIEKRMLAQSLRTMRHDIDTEIVAHG